jgi:hypothetical protein
LNISVYRLQPRLFIDSLPYVKKPQKNHKELRMSLITGNKVKKKPHKPRYCEKEKDKANKRILRRLSFDNNGLVKPSCGTTAKQ